jgi:hypothetical protein
MMKSLTIYSRLKVSDLDLLVEDFKVRFDQELKDFFTDEELKLMEPKIDSIAAIYVQPIISELAFDDFYFNPKDENALREFFDQCQSAIVFENMPFLESNIFQVSYIQELLGLFEEGLIDRGGISNLIFKSEFLNEIKNYKGIDTLLVSNRINERPSKSALPVDPIDFLVQDVYAELLRLRDQNINPAELPPKVQKILQAIKDEKLDPQILFSKTGLNPKDFDDGLEKLKFWLKRK